MKVTAKFLCQTVSKTKFSSQDQGSAQVELTAVPGNSEENKEFWEYTPSGNLEMTIKNEAAEKYFEPGEEYFLTFEKAN